MPVQKKPPVNGRKSHLKLRTLADLARHLDVSMGKLQALAEQLDREREHTALYHSWEQSKKSSGTRPIDAPREKLKRVQKRVNGTILQQLIVHPAARGGVRGRDLLSNVTPHIGKRTVDTYDLENFFLTVTSKRVYEFFCSVGCAPDVARLLTRITTFKGRLPQGAPTSPMLAVLVAGSGNNNSLYQRLQKLADKNNGDFTIYIDDITMSGAAHLPRLSGTIERIVQQSGFKINQKKTRFREPHEQQTVTGIVVNKKPNVPRKERRRIRTVLHHYKNTGVQNETNTLKSHLRGKIAHVQSVNPEQGVKLLSQFNAIDWTGTSSETVVSSPSGGSAGRTRAQPRRGLPAGG